MRVGWWVGRAGSCKPGRYCAKGFAMAPAFWSQHSQSMKPFAGLRCDNRAIAVTESKYIGCSVIEWLGGHEIEMMIRDGGENDPCLPVWKVWNSSGTSWNPPDSKPHSISQHHQPKSYDKHDTLRPFTSLRISLNIHFS